MNKPEFNGPVVEYRKRHKQFNGFAVTILYGAQDAEGNACRPQENAQDGHGTWYGIDVDGDYTMFSWQHSAAEGGQIDYGTPFKEDALSVMKTQLEEKRQLARRAEILAEGNYEGDDPKAEMEEVQKEWDGLYNWNTPLEKESEKRLKTAQAAFQKQFEAYSSNLAQKTALVEEAEKLTEMENIRDARNALRDLRSKYNEIGSIGRSADHELSSRLNAVSRTLSDKQKEYFATLDARHAEAKEKKTALLAEIKNTVDNVVNFRDGSAKMDALFEQWKAAGSAGKEEDDALWEQYKKLRNQFSDKRRAFFKERNEAFKVSEEKKRALIEEAKKISATGDYSRENTERMKQLDQEWKAAGYSGKEDNDALWKEFSEAKEVFWDGKKGAMVQKVQSSIDAKKAEITKLTGSNEDLNYRIEITDQPKLKDEFRRTIDFNQSKIESLEHEVEELQKKIES